MLEPETRLRLKGCSETLVISAGAWRELVEIARERGWQSERAIACYWGDIGLEVTAIDARRLALALEALGDHLLHHDNQYPCESVDALIDDLGVLVVFCRAGAFRVC